MIYAPKPRRDLHASRVVHDRPACAVRRTVLKAQSLFIATVTGERNAVGEEVQLVQAVTVLVVGVFDG